MPYIYTGTRIEGWNDEAARLEELYLEEQKELRKEVLTGGHPQRVVACAWPTGAQPVSLALMWYRSSPLFTNTVKDGVLFVNRSLRAGEFVGVVWTDTDREEMMPAGVIIYAVPVRGLRPLWLKLQSAGPLKLTFSPGVDPAANELDPESERQESEVRSQESEDGLWAGRPCHKLDALAVPVVPEGSVVDGRGLMSDAEEVAMLEEGLVSYQWAWNEGADLATEELAGGWRADELMRRVFAPCPYKLGSLPRVWWLRGFKETVDAAERAAAAA